MSGDPNFRDWQHAHRLYNTNDHRFSPKVKFLFHVSFFLTPEAKKLVPSAFQHLSEIGMLVKTVDLPKFSAETQTMNMYNRKKNVQKHIEYLPVTITMHDDNAGVSRHLMEGYYKYYFVDGLHEWDSGAYGTNQSGDITYKGSSYFKYNFGMDINRKPAPFFEKIEISQLARGEYFKCTLIRPMLSEWNHDTMDNGDGGGIAANTLTVVYDGVNYSKGTTAQDTPVGFRNEAAYDNWEG